MKYNLKKVWSYTSVRCVIVKFYEPVAQGWWIFFFEKTFLFEADAKLKMNNFFKWKKFKK